MRAATLFAALLAAVAAVTAASPELAVRQLGKRDTLQTCSDLTISSNNGDRKVVLVIDTSGSMSGSDPDDLRLAAARALNDFLISGSEAGGGRKADQVAVVGFSSFSYTVFAPGDPGDPAADEAISAMDANGGTFIASGVYEAIDHINAMQGETRDRSAIVVFTDGSDSDTPELVSAINSATSLGIRVSFGYLDTGSSQPDEVLLALRDSKGVYATIAFAAGSQNFVNYVLLNGLTYQDNPQGAGDRLLSGLGTTQFISGSSTVALKYGAERGEIVNFTVVSFTSDRLSVEAKMGGQSLYASTRATSSRQFFEVTAPGTGQLDLFVTSPDSPTDGLFSVLTNSNQPIKNCTVGVAAKEGGLTPGATAGVAIGVIAAVAALAGGSFWAYKHHFGAGDSTVPPGGNTTGTSGMEGNHTSFNTGTEKVHPDTSVSPVGQQPLGSPPVNNMAMDRFGSVPSSGFEGNMTGQNLGNATQTAPLPNPNGTPLTGPGGIPPMDTAPVGAPGGGGSGWGVPGTFIPPMMPPLVSPKDQQSMQDAAPGSMHSQQTTNPQQPLIPQNAYQNPGAAAYPNQYQQHLGGNLGGVYQQHLGAHNGTHPLMGSSPTSGSGSGIGVASESNTLVSHSPDPHNCVPPQNPNNVSGPASSSSPFSSGNSTASTTAAYPAPSQQNHTGVGQWNANHTGLGPSSIPGQGVPMQPHVPSKLPDFTVPSPPSWPQHQQPARDDDQRHHHHPWLAPDMACEHPECDLNLPGHVCFPDRETCACVCSDAGCPVLKRGW